MDQVTQGTAASAEESASASEELSAQAQALNQIVRDLEALVGGDEQSSSLSAPATRKRSPGVRGRSIAKGLGGPKADAPVMAGKPRRDEFPMDNFGEM